VNLGIEPESLPAMISSTKAVFSSINKQGLPSLLFKELVTQRTPLGLGRLLLATCSSMNFEGVKPEFLEDTSE
jgi:hypothetical protein